jgi:serine/threonine protein kinase
MLIGRRRFYTAELCLALKWFHDKNLLYRNLNLHDILLGIDGHIKLVDFVVSKIDIRPESTTKTFCGGAEFMAPEVNIITGYEFHGPTRPLTNHKFERYF